MTEEGVRKVVARLITDESFKKAFEENPTTAVEKSGYAVSGQELTALSKIKPNDLKLNIRKRGAEAGAFDVGTFTSVKTA